MVSMGSSECFAPDVWTEDRIRALGVRIDGLTACKIVYGVGRTRAYEMLHANQVDFRVIRAGRKYVVPSSEVLRVLGLDSASTA